MAIGNQPQNGSLNSTLAQYIGLLRDHLNRINTLYNYANSLGSSGLQGTGMTSGDATAYLTAIGQLNLMWQVFNGQGTVPTSTNYYSLLSGTLSNAGLV